MTVMIIYVAELRVTRTLVIINCKHQLRTTRSPTHPTVMMFMKIIDILLKTMYCFMKDSCFVDMFVDTFVETFTADFLHKSYSVERNADWHCF